MIEPLRLVIHVHRQPGAAGYGTVEPVPYDQLAVPSLVPAMAVRPPTSN